MIKLSLRAYSTVCYTTSDIREYNTILKLRNQTFDWFHKLPVRCFDEASHLLIVLESYMKYIVNCHAYAV